MFVSRDLEGETTARVTDGDDGVGLGVLVALAGTDVIAGIALQLDHGRGGPPVQGPHRWRVLASAAHDGDERDCGDERAQTNLQRASRFGALQIVYRTQKIVLAHPASLQKHYKGARVVEPSAEWPAR